MNTRKEMFGTGRNAAQRAKGESPALKRIRMQHPVLVGAVYWNPQEESPSHLLKELKRIRETGFTFVRYHVTGPEERSDGTFDFRYADIRMDAARKAKLMAVPHFHLGVPSSWALRKAGVGEKEAGELGISDPTVREAIRHRMAAIIGRYRQHPALAFWMVGGEPHAGSIPLRTELDRRRFLEWLKTKYATPNDVHRAWALYPRRKPVYVGSWDEALRRAALVDGSGDGVVLATTDLRHEAFGTVRDLYRFRADMMLARIRGEVALVRELDPHHPVGVGNHQLMLNHAAMGWDVHASGSLGDMHFTSIHLSWHFEAVRGEVDRPVYMQSRLTRDANKSGLGSAYETTGGPVQYSGGYGHHMDAGLMRRLLLNYLGAGNEVLAFWSWTFRPGGLEAGEYALTTLSGRVSDWAKEIGRIAEGMRKHSAELWSAHTEPDLAILRSWDTEAILTMEPRHFFLEEGPSRMTRAIPQQHMRALVGASRAAINKHLAFEYVSEDEIIRGIAGAYPAVYLPHVRACPNEVLEALLDYVRAGGRVLADVQSGFMDQWGKVRPRGRGSLLEKLFGGWVDVVHEGRTRNTSVDGMPVEGFYGDLVLTHARVVATFGDGRPAASEYRNGKGSAMLMAFDPAWLCWKPGRMDIENWLAKMCLGGRERGWWSDAPIIVRRSSKRADHWFIVNDGPERDAELCVYDRRYTRGIDVLSGEQIRTGQTIRLHLPGHSGLWIRLAAESGAG